MKKLMITGCAILSFFSVTGPARAASVVQVNDASQVKFLVSDDKVFLRNLGQFHSQWQGCCYNYWFDLSTETGKAHYAYFLLRYASAKSVSMLVLDPAQSSAIHFMGDF